MEKLSVQDLASYLKSEAEIEELLSSQRHEVVLVDLGQ